MRWLDLLFAHWSIDPDVLEARLPRIAGLELDRFEGRGWLGVVPFTMADVAPRGLPAVPLLRPFPEVNVRTYVRYRKVPGIWFLSLDATSRLMVLGGRNAFHVPYHRAVMRTWRDGEAVGFESTRVRGEPDAARFRATFSPTGPVALASVGSFEAWSTQRLRVFAVDGTGALWRTEIDHGPWRLQPAEAVIAGTGLVEAAGLTLPDEAPRLSFSSRMDVRGWWPTRA